MALEHPQNQVGRIHADGRVELEDAKMLQWMRGLWSGNPEELECPMKGYADPGTESAGAVIPAVVGSQAEARAPAAPLRLRVAARPAAARL